MLGLALALSVLALPGGNATDTMDLTLDQALRIALGQSPARIQVDVSKTQGASTLARGITGLIPSVSATVGYGTSDAGPGMLPESLLTGGEWSWTGSLTLNQVVFDPSVFAGLAGAVVYSGYYASEAKDRQAKLIYDVTANYLNLLRTRLLLDATLASQRRAEENLRIVTEKKSLGAASVIDLMRSEVLKAQSDIEVLKAEKSLAVATEMFKATVNIDGDVTVRPTEDLVEPAEFEIADPDSLLEEIIDRNPGLAMAHRANTAAGINTASAIGKALPSISAYWSTSYADSLFPSSVDHWKDNDVVSYGVRASFPLLDLKTYVLNIVDASNDARRARATALTATLQIRSTATSAILGYVEARETYAFATGNLELNRRLFELASEQHRLGALSLADFFSVEATLAQAQATHVGALCDTYIQAAQINYLLGASEMPRKETE